MTKNHMTRMTVVCLALLIFSSVLSGSQLTIPGTIHQLCYYTNFFYNLPQSDLVYYLNDRLLYSEPPDGKLFDNGLRSKLINVVQIHTALKDFISKYGDQDSNQVTISIDDPEGEKQAIQLCILFGLELRKEDTGQFSLMVDSSEGIIDFHKLLNLNLAKMEKQINQDRFLHFRLKEERVSIPWDFEFLNEITGLDLTGESFFKTMVENEKFSLLLATLYRLSHHEVEYISDLLPEKINGAWEAIYNDKKLLTGMFLLSAALRAEENRLRLPGGPQTGDFWSKLVGVDFNDRYKFLKALATREEGKLAFLYVFSYFLPEAKQKALLFDFDSVKLRKILDSIQLNKQARLQISRLPRLESFGYFTLLYTLQIKEGKIIYPAGIETWQAVFTPALPVSPVQSGVQLEDIEKSFQFLSRLVDSSKKSDKRKSELQIFISLYSKFINRPEILTKETLKRLHDMYQDHDIMVDFIEKIPLKKPQSILLISNWMDRLNELGNGDKTLFVAIFQSLLEIIAYQSKYDPTERDTDFLLEGLLNISLNREEAYDQLFTFFQTQMKVRLDKSRIDRDFLNKILTGIPNQYITMGDLAYRFMVQDQIRAKMLDIIQSQEVSALSDLLEINEVLKEAINTPPSAAKDWPARLNETFKMLSYPDISPRAPKFIKDRVVPYLQEDLNKTINNLAAKIQSSASAEDKDNLVARIKKDYLIYHLKDFLLTTVYALHAKSERMRIFLNPNLTRLHNFTPENGFTPWNHCGTPQTKKRFSGYHFQGGLSRLNFAFSHSWKDHLFSRNIIYDKKQIEAVLTNVLDLYPITQVRRAQSYVGLLVEFGLELIQKSKKNDPIMRGLKPAIGAITSGYHYRKIMDYLDDITNNYYLFFFEIFKLGERFLEQDKFLDQFSRAGELGMLTKTHLHGTVMEEINQFGGLYHATFGTVTPRYMDLFPPEVANLFLSDSTGGETINEFKIKTAYHAFKKGYAPQLLGQFLYEYLHQTGRRFFAQNYVKDYYSTHFIFDILNNSHLNKIIKKLQSKGYVRLK